MFCYLFMLSGKEYYSSDWRCHNMHVKVKIRSTSLIVVMTFPPVSFFSPIPTFISPFSLILLFPVSSFPHSALPSSCLFSFPALFFPCFLSSFSPYIPSIILLLFSFFNPCTECDHSSATCKVIGLTRWITGKNFIYLKPYVDNLFCSFCYAREFLLLHFQSERNSVR